MTYAGIAAKVEIAFVANPYGTLTWTDVTAQVVSLKTTSGRNYETGKNESSTVNLVLRNQDGRFNPLNTSSPYAPNVLPFRPVRITAAATTGGTVYPVWYGYVQRWPQSVKDQTSQYEIVQLTGVDAFKAVLGFVPGDPYDVKVRKDYGAYVAPGSASPYWQFVAFDELTPPFAGTNGGSYAAMIGTGVTSPTKATPSPCRTAVVFNGTQGLYASGSYYVGEMWFKQDAAAAAAATPGTAQVLATSVYTANTGAVSYTYLTGQLPGSQSISVGGVSSNQPTTSIFLLKNFTNLMPSDSSASFETSVADWVSETPANVSVSQSTVHPLYGTSAMRLTLPVSAGGVVSLATHAPVTAGTPYSCSLSFAGSSTTLTMNLAIRWYDNTGTLITTGPTSYLTTTTANSYLSLTTGPLTAPAGAVSASVILTPTLQSGVTGTVDVDGVMLVGSAGRHLGVDVIPYIAPSAGSTSTLYLVAPSNVTNKADQFIIPAPAPGAWHLLSWAPSIATGNPAFFAVDGVSQATAGTVTINSSSATAQPMNCLGGTAYSGTMNANTGYVGQIAALWTMSVVAGSGLIPTSAVYAAQHYSYGTTASGSARTHDFTSELTSQRVNDVLTAIAFPPSMLSLETGLTTMTASGNVAGTAATALIEAAADAELGNVFVDASGIVTFHNRNHRNSPTSVAAFGGDGGIPYEGNIVIDFDDTYVYNDIQVTQAGASPSYVYEIQDVASQNTYGVRSLTPSIQVVNQSDVQSMGATLLGRYKDPHPRLATLSFELRSKPTYLAQVMALKIGDLITVNHKPLGGTSYTLQVFIDGISHTVDEGQWLITFNTTPLYGPPAPPAPQAPGTYPAVYTATY
jgi:hypothetical protein